jgi:pimeloyl-ACP methyl ester carboxylesterase
MNLSINGRRLSYEIHGEGPPILFVHGFPLSGRLWESVVLGFAYRNRCLVPDLRGHGKSEPSRSATMGDYAEDLAALLNALDERRPVVLAGMSMGGDATSRCGCRSPGDGSA